MENIILFDSEVRNHLLPLTYTRPVADIRLGIFSIREKWENMLNGRASYITQEYLSDKFPILITDDNFVINGSVLPSEKLCQMILNLDFNEAFLCGGELIAARLNSEQFDLLTNNEEIEELKGFEISQAELSKINRLADILTLHDTAIREDFRWISQHTQPSAISGANTILGGKDLFLGVGVQMEGATINTRTGPVFIGNHVEVMEGAIIRGPVAILDHSIIKMGAKIYGPTTIGPHSRIGGEVKNVLFQGYSNKAHDGFLGDSYIGEWCNLGADTNNSNLKNNYSEVKLWNYVSKRFELTGLLFCGLFMGDHSKCGINTMFNTGTIVGVSANIFGTGYPRNFIPSFSWGGPQGMSTYKLEDALETARNVMSRRQIPFTDTEEKILSQVFELSAEYRKF